MSIDRYDPIRVIGEGSFGKVYLMRDKVKRNFVCVKIIKIKNIPKKERDATKAEVDLLRRLHHPNIVRYFDSFISKNGESLCICMEYCDGGDLASQVKAARKNLFSESKILHWFVQLTLGLHYMHTNKVLHRDLKTQNVFLLGNGRLVLGDLGISKVLDGTMDFAQTCIGTPYYMSPEIFKNKPYSYKSDVWALGCVLYEMTTLNHAFDANSLNGLATKIVKGKYPPIHAKYSRFLRELIGQMLLINPQQRPDLDQILRKPFIKKHIVNFFTDIAARPSNSIGEGTMIVKAAAGGFVNASAVSNDTNMISLRQQLHSLEMTQAVQEALAPKPALAEVDDVVALKIAKEQAGALKREQEHKKMVETALEKLRIERENRLKERAVIEQQVKPQYKGKQPVAIVQQQQQPKPSVQPPRQPNQQILNNGPSSEAVRKEYAVRDRGLNWNKKSDDRSDDYSSVASSARDREKEKQNAIMNRNGSDRDRDESRRRRNASDEKEKNEREKKILDEKRRLALFQQQQAEEKKREDMKNEARAREEARLRDEAIRQREESLAKQKQEQMRAQAESVARREKLREKERERQREEIEQLKKDKIELDRRSNERDRLREERRALERARLEGISPMSSRKDSIDIVQEKLSYMNDQIQIHKADRNERNRRSFIAEEKAEMTDRERVFLRKQEKQAKEEAERLEALKEAESENRKFRVDAQNQYRNLYHNNNQQQPSYDNNNNNGRGVSNIEDASYQFNPAGRGKVRDAMDLDELNDRLNEVSKGKPRFENDSANSNKVLRNSNNRLTSQDENIDSEEDDEGDELWTRNANNIDSNNVEEEDEDLHKKEEELKAELTFATLRVEELRRTLQETKTFISAKDVTSSTIMTNRQQTKANNPFVPKQFDKNNNNNNNNINNSNHYSNGFANGDDEEEDEDDDVYSGDDDDQEQQQQGLISARSSRPQSPKNKNYGNNNNNKNFNYNNDSKSSSSIQQQQQMQDPAETIRRYKPNVDKSSYQMLQDMPSPSGRLSDRIERLRHRCIDALGKTAFEDAYFFLKQNDDESQGYENGRDLNDENFELKKISRIRAILGEGKAVYGGLIEQLIFMEETHMD